MIKKTVLLLTTAITVLLALVACSSVPDEMTVEQVTGFSQAYFQKSHNKSIVVKSIAYQRIGEHEYRNIVTVSEGETEYKLYLDASNKPMFDNVSATEIKKNIDISALEEKITPLGLKLNEYYGINVAPLYEDKRCTVLFSVFSIDRPNKDSKDSIYSLLEILNAKGIDELNISVHTPDFLLPKPEFGYGMYGPTLGSESFETNIDTTSFEKKYYDFVGRFYWDKQKFDDKISELTQLGYKNAHFFIKQEYNPYTIEVNLYCEADFGLSYEQAENLLLSMDESCFKIRDRKTIYTLLEK